MKKIKSLIILITIISLTSCSNNELKCDNSLVKRTLKEIIEEEMLKEKVKLKRILGIDEEYLTHFIRNNIKLNLIRTRAINKEIKSCECTANMELNLKPEVVDYILKKAQNNELNYSVDRVNKMINQKVDINYSAQETSEGKVYVETIMPDEVGELLGSSFSIEEYFKESKVKRFVSLENNRTIELYFKTDNEVEIKILSYDHVEEFDLEYKDGKLINNNLPDNLKDKYYILEGDKLKVFINDEEGYDVYNKK